MTSLGGVNGFFPDWVREELILVDAKEGREMILKKVAEWKIMQKMPDECKTFPGQEGAAAKAQESQSCKAGQKRSQGAGQVAGAGSCPQEPCSKNCHKT